jgi:hypothetical protein
MPLRRVALLRRAKQRMLSRKAGLDQTDVSDVEMLRAWLTTVVARVRLDMLRMRTSWSTTGPERSQPSQLPPAPNDVCRR